MLPVVAEIPQPAEGSTDAQKRAKAGTKRKRGKNDGDEDAPKTKLPRRSKIVNCEGCRIRKSKCDHVRPGCSQCKLTGMECVYSKDAQPIPGLIAILSQGGKSVPEIFARFRSAFNDLEAAMANHLANGSKDSGDAPITMSFILNADGYFAGPSALASYPSILDTPASRSTTLVGETSLHSHGGMPSSAFDLQQIPESYHLLLDSQRLRTTVSWYKDHVVQEFRFATPEVLEGLCHLDPQSPLLLYACAVAFLHTPNPSDAAHIAPVYFQLAQEQSQRRDSFGAKSGIDTLEALLLQAQYLFSTRGDPEKIWRIAGDCVRLAVSLGLHREARQLAGYDADANRRRWAMHNSLFLDRWTSFISGRPSALRNREFNTALPDDGEGKFGTHCELFEFVRILGDVMEETSSIFAMSYERGEALDQRLREFLAGTSNAGSNVAGRFNSINVRLMGQHVRAMMHKPRIHLEDGCEAVQQEEEDRACNFIGDAAKSVIVEAGNIPAKPAGRLAWAPHIIEVAAQLLTKHDMSEARNLLPNAANALSWWEEAPIASSEQKTVDQLLRFVAGNVRPDMPPPPPPPAPIANMSFEGLLRFDVGAEDDMPFLAGGPFVIGDEFYREPEPMPASVDPSLLLGIATQ
ncbi:hypothetical protein AURDEDRAFT_114698 [Auricularia subglabra TFB-10046 SS5]|nr:hypothetical protein AURDEDRAFT_114698 [Auricularia subglabra TFB-10046 SS5]